MKNKRDIISDKKHTSRWTLFYANVRGIVSKKLSIINILGEMNPEHAKRNKWYQH